MISKLKKTSTKATPKKKIMAKTSPAPKAAKSVEKEPKLESKSSLHRMLTAEGWKRIMMKKES